MNIKRVNITNFRGFASFSAEFHDRLTVLVGNNGSGKSSLLDALAIAAGAFLQGLDGVASNGISKGDAHNKCCDTGGVVRLKPQYPVSISAEGECVGLRIRWQRDLNSQTGRTSSGDANQLLSIASDCQQRVRDNDPSLILPLLAYYGPNRRWEQRQTRQTSGPLEPLSRLDGYADCLAAEPNETRMLKWFEALTVQEIQSANHSPELTTVQEAISRCYASMTGAHNVNVQFNLDTYGIDITASNSSGTASRYPMKDLSGGLQNTLGLVSDIAYRMAVLNPQLLDHVLDQTPGIVLIDEIELHLHPILQQRILADLQAIFPGVQFIVCTNAPCVIGSVRKENLLVLTDSSEAYSPCKEVYGCDSNTVLRNVMGADERVPSIKQAFQAFYEAMDQEQLERARGILEALETQIGFSDPELTAARVTLDLEELEEMQEEVPYG